MTARTDGIDHLRAIPAGEGLWRVSFRSAHPGCCHQLYANGRLRAVTDHPADRSFCVRATDAPQEVAILAVPPAVRLVDFADALPESARQPGWVFQARLPRSPQLGRDHALTARHDGATGEMSPQPAWREPAWPGWVPRWAFGEDRFGDGAFGWDGAMAAGLGEGAFGAGPFGIDADAIDVRLPLRAEGLHQIALESVAPDGSLSAPLELLFDAQPPPAPPVGVSVTAYHPADQTLTIDIQRG